MFSGFPGPSYSTWPGSLTWIFDLASYRVQLYQWFPCVLLTTFGMELSMEFNINITYDWFLWYVRSSSLIFR